MDGATQLGFAKSTLLQVFAYSLIFVTDGHGRGADRNVFGHVTRPLTLAAFGETDRYPSAFPFPENGERHGLMIVSRSTAESLFASEKFL